MTASCINAQRRRSFGKGDPTTVLVFKPHPDLRLPERIRIPPGMTLADLRVIVDPGNRQLSYDWGAIERIAEFNGLPRSHFRGLQASLVPGLIVPWYQQMLKQGYGRDPILEYVSGLPELWERAMGADSWARCAAEEEKEKARIARAHEAMKRI